MKKTPNRRSAVADAQSKRARLSVLLSLLTASVAIGQTMPDTFLRLRDTPKSYAGQAGKFVLVNAAENKLEFGSGGPTPTATATATPTNTPTPTPTPTPTATAVTLTIGGVAQQIDTNRTWTFPHSFGFTADGSSSTLTTGVTGYITLKESGTITGWSITADGSSPTCTIDVWKIATGTVLPTVANTIFGTKPALSSGNAKVGTCPGDCTGWTTTLANHDIIGFNIDAVTVATKLTFQIEYTK